MIRTRSTNCGSNACRVRRLRKKVTNAPPSMACAMKARGKRRSMPCEVSMWLQFCTKCSDTTDRLHGPARHRQKQPCRSRWTRTGNSGLRQRLAGSDAAAIGAWPQKDVGYAGYELLTTLAQRQLQLGQSVILDSVASIEAVRTRWRELATTYQARWRVIECVCSDEAVHRARLAVRERGIPGWYELTWKEVERVKDYYAAWQDERLIIDAANPLSDNIAAVLNYLS